MLFTHDIVSASWYIALIELQKPPSISWLWWDFGIGVQDLNHQANFIPSMPNIISSYIRNKTAMNER